MEATERDRQEQEFAAQSDAENAAENVYSPSEYERIKLKPLMPAILAIGGVKQTRGYVIARELKGLNQAQNLDELKDVLLDATNALMALDIFEAVEFTLDDEPLQREVGVAATTNAWRSPDVKTSQLHVYAGKCLCLGLGLWQQMRRPCRWLVHLHKAAAAARARGLWHMAVQGYHANHYHDGKLARAPALSSWAQLHCTQQNQNQACMPWHPDMQCRVSFKLSQHLISCALHRGARGSCAGCCCE